MKLKLKFQQQVRIIKKQQKNHSKKLNPILKHGMDQMILMWYQIIQHFLTSLVYLCGKERKCVQYDIDHINISLRSFSHLLQANYLAPTEHFNRLKFVQKTKLREITNMVGLGAKISRMEHLLFPKSWLGIHKSLN